MAIVSNAKVNAFYCSNTKIVEALYLKVVHALITFYRNFYWTLKIFLEFVTRS